MFIFGDFKSFSSEIFSRFLQRFSVVLFGDNQPYLEILIIFMEIFRLFMEIYIAELLVPWQGTGRKAGKSAAP